MPAVARRPVAARGSDARIAHFPLGGRTVVLGRLLRLGRCSLDAAGTLVAQLRRQPSPLAARLYMRRIEAIRTMQSEFRTVVVDPAEYLVAARAVDVAEVDRAAVAVTTDRLRAAVTRE